MRKLFVVIGAALSLGILGAGWAAAEDLGPEQARAFVVGKVFSYTCFEGTSGVGRIFPDGSVVGTIRIRSEGETRFAALPPGTIRRTVRRCARTCRAYRLRRASGCKRSTTEASAVQSLDWILPIATSINPVCDRTLSAARPGRQPRRR
jgi:hypothetical protein